MLNNENRQLFGDQVRDHVSKLNDLMGRGSGDRIDPEAVRKSCFAGRLLEGSTRMLGLLGWSRSLTLLRELLERSAAAGRPWDEHISQIVSEILEAEEQAIDSLLADGEGGVEDDRFGGFSQELEFLLAEPFEPAPGERAETVRIETPAAAAEGRREDEQTAADEAIEGTASCERPVEAEDGRGPRMENGRIGCEIPAAETDPPAASEENGAPDPLEQALFHADGATDPMPPANEFATISRLQGSLCLINDRLEECLLEACGSDGAVRDLEMAIGECEFFISMLSGMLGRIGESRKPLRSKVSSAIVMDGLRDFLEVHKRIRNWKAELQTRTDEFSLDCAVATDLAVILEGCVYDICATTERAPRGPVSVKVDVSASGTWLTAHIYDDGGSYLSDSEIDRDDAMAYYQGLRQARPLLGKRGGLLWVEPGGEGGERFRFTFPRTTVLTDYHLLDAAGMTFAVQRQSVESVLRRTGIALCSDGGLRYLEHGGRTIPVCSIGELAADEIASGDEGDHIVVVGTAEKRLGICSNGPGHKIEGLIEQVTDDRWGALSKRLLHMGEKEYPVLDIDLLLERYAVIQGLVGDDGQTGSWSGVEEPEMDNETVSRA